MPAKTTGNGALAIIELQLRPGGYSSVPTSSGAYEQSSWIRVKIIAER